MFSLRNQKKGIVLQDAKERKILKNSYVIGRRSKYNNCKFPSPDSNSLSGDVLS